MMMTADFKFQNNGVFCLVALRELSVSLNYNQGRINFLLFMIDVSFGERKRDNLEL